MPHTLFSNASLESGHLCQAPLSSASGQAAHGDGDGRGEHHKTTLFRRCHTESKSRPSANFLFSSFQCPAKDETRGLVEAAWGRSVPAVLPISLKPTPIQWPLRISSRSAVNGTLKIGRERAPESKVEQFLCNQQLLVVPRIVVAA
mgnify:CR=1 FL=1